MENCSLNHFINFSGSQKSADPASTVGSMVSLECRSDDIMARRWRKRLSNKKHLLKRKTSPTCLQEVESTLLQKKGLQYMYPCIHNLNQFTSINFNNGECLPKIISRNTKGESWMTSPVTQYMHKSRLPLAALPQKTIQ